MSTTIPSRCLCRARHLWFLATITLVLILGIGLPIGALVLVGMSLRHPTPLRSLTIGSALILVTVVTMVLLRDMVRDAMLADHFRLGSIPVAPQMGVFSLFAVLLVIGLVTVGWMLKVHFGSAQPPVSDR